MKTFVRAALIATAGLATAAVLAACAPAPAAHPGFVTVTAPAPESAASSGQAPASLPAVPAAFGGKGADTSGPQPGDDYPQPWRSAAPDSMFDTWREYNRECTSFVAWALHSRNHYDMPFYANAGDWGARAQSIGVRVDSAPAVGAVAWRGGSNGHVAWVAAVSGSTVTIEEYNHVPYSYDWRNVAAGSFSYVHFADLAQPAPPAQQVIVAANPQIGAGAVQGSGAGVQGGAGAVQGSGSHGSGNIIVPGPATHPGNPPQQHQSAPPQNQPAPQPAPQPAARPVYSVMNTSEQPPDGVYFRNSPHTADTSRIYADGVFAGDQVRVRCSGWGDAVGPYNNTVWYYVDNVTRPTVPSNGAANSGWLNAHYINDGLNTNQVEPGVPAC